MQRESALAGGFLVVVLAMLLGAAVVPGVVAEQREDVRPSYFDIRHDDGSIRAASVSGGTATLQIETRVRHDGGTAENVTLEVRAVDSESGLLEDRVETDLGTFSGEQERSVLTNLTVEREGGYHIDTAVYQDGVSEDRERRTIRGVGSLTPEYARSTVKFQTFQSTSGDLPSITYRIADVEDDRSTLNVSANLLNAGDDTTEDLRLVLRARQSESNVVADQTTIGVGSIRPGRTVTPGAELTVPDGYNYWLDAILMKDGVVIDTASEAANLDPQRTLQPDEQRTEVGFRSGDFEETERDRDDDRPTSTPSGGSGPGFGPVAAIAALLGAALLVRRRNND